MSEVMLLSDEELQVFLDEMGEHLSTLETELLDVERGITDPDQVARIFRAAHTIKGGAATAGFDGMAHMTHAMETLFDRMRSGTLIPGREVVSALLSAVDVLRDMLGLITDHNPPGEPPAALVETLLQAGTVTPAVIGSAVAQPSSMVRVDQSALVVKIRLTPDCAMPSVRALQVMLALEEYGDIVGSEPVQADIDAERVKDTLTVFLATDKSADFVRQVLQRVPDLVQVDIEVQTPEGSVTAPLPPVGGVEPEIAQQQAAGGGPARPGARSTGEDRTIRVDVALLDALMNLVGELVIDRGRLAGIGQTLSLRSGAQDLAEELGQVSGHLNRVTTTLQEAVLKARMLPIGRVFAKFPRMVRDLAQQLGKQIDFQVFGEETELDRSMLEVLGDPLMHLLRNALDHGMESVEERRRKGKSDTARLELIAMHEANHVVILVRDDGRGIDPEKIREVAVRRGVLSIERAKELSERDAIQLLFAPGFSTADKVTDVSGRGVGLDVVRRNVERVTGRIEVESQVGKGTTFRVMLPLTLATIRALLVQVDRDTLAIPLSVVAQTLRVVRSEVSSIKGRWVTRVRGRVVPLLWLKQFTQAGTVPDLDASSLLSVLVNFKGELIGLVVDRLLGEQEVVVKGLGGLFGHVKGTSGATILGDGNLALILDIGGLIALLSAENARSLDNQLSTVGVR